MGEAFESDDEDKSDGERALAREMRAAQAQRLVERGAGAQGPVQQAQEEAHQVGLGVCMPAWVLLKPPGHKGERSGGGAAGVHACLGAAQGAWQRGGCRRTEARSALASRCPQGRAPAVISAPGQGTLSSPWRLLFRPLCVQVIGLGGS